MALSAVRLLLTFTPIGTAPTTPPSSQTLVFAVLWVVSYGAEGIAGWLLWRRSGTRRYGRAVLVAFWTQIGLQVLRLGDLAASRLLPPPVPWAAFVTIALLVAAAAVTTVVAWSVSRTASAVLGAVLVWLLVVTAITGGDAVLRWGPPLS